MILTNLSNACYRIPEHTQILVHFRDVVRMDYDVEVQNK